MFSLLSLSLWILVSQVKPPFGLGSIEGVVVRENGAAPASPVPEARVELTPGERVVFTNAMGEFQFRDLLPGTYSISSAHDGLVSVKEKRVPVSADQTVKNVALPMMPTPVIAGRVIDPGGEPLAAALVRAYHRTYTAFGSQLKIVRKGMTNDAGEFRLFDLDFGQYFVSAGYSDRNRAAAIGKTKLSENVSKADDGYGTVFYDTTEDLSQARSIHLAPGSDSGAVAFFLGAPARFRIRGEVVPLAAGVRIFFAPKGSDLTDPESFIEPNTNGAFEIRGVSPRPYLLLASANNGVMESQVVTANVADADVDGVRLVLANTMTVPGTLSLEGDFGPGGIDLSKLHVKLRRSATEFEQTIDARVRPDGTFTLEHVAEHAEYDVTVEPLVPKTYFESISVGGKSLLQGKAPIPPNEKLQIVLTKGRGIEDITVTNRGEPAAAARVVLIPEPNLRRRPDRYITGFTDESGKLRLSELPTGTYTAYAFEKIEPDGAYAIAYSPEAEDRFRDHALTIHVEFNPPPDPRPERLIVIPKESTQGFPQ
jgi:hypothetical protein